MITNRTNDSEKPRTVSAAGKIETIQALRGIAAFVVVLWHASGLVAPYGTGFTLHFMPGGAFGVSLFFLISGFIMVHTTRNCDGSALYCGDFLIRRLARIWPVYAIATIALVVIRPPSGISFAWVFESLTFQPHGAGPAPGFGYPILGVGWTLNYEIYFYLVFGLSMLFGRARWWVMGAWFVGSLILLPLVLGRQPSFTPTTSYDLSVAYLNLISNPINWMFFGGCLFGLLSQVDKLSIKRTAVALALLVLTTSMVALQWVTGFRTVNGINGVGLSLIPFFGVVVLSLQSLPTKVPRFLTYLGDVSYSLYLIHPIVIGSYFGVIRLIDIPIDSNVRYFGFGATILVSLVIASLSHHWIEANLSRRVQRLLRQVVLGGRVPLSRNGRVAKEALT